MSSFNRHFCALVALYGICATGFARVEIQGLDEELQLAALSAISLKREPCEAPDWRLDALHQRTEEEIRSVLEARGFYSAQIASEIDHDADCWIAHIVVDPGSPVVIRDVETRILGGAASDPDFKRILQESTLTSRRQLNQAEYEQLKTQLTTLAQRKGYADARFSQSRIDVYPDELAADIALEFDSGARYTFGEIAIQQDFLNENLVRRFIDFRTGDPYDRTKLTALYNSLIDSGYFGLVDVRPLAADPELRQIPLRIELTPGNRKTLSYGGGYSTDTGPRLRIARNNRRLNARGAQRNINAELSPVLSEFTVAYRFPQGDPRFEWVSLDAGLMREDSETVQSESVDLGARRIVRRWQDWQETQFINFLVEDFEIAEEVDRTTLLQPGMSWLRVRADNTIRPTKGDKLTFEISAASDRIVSDTSFVQTIAEARWIRSFSSASRVLTRLRAGATWNNDFESLPPSARFFAGGDNSIRGYEFHSQGPVDADGQVIGGDRLLVGSVEYEHRLKERWSFATFYDAGNAFHEREVNAVAGFGIGARWLSPLGPIRLDVARPLDGLDHGLRLHISLGPDL